MNIYGKYVALIGVMVLMLVATCLGTDETTHTEEMMTEAMPTHAPPSDNATQRISTDEV